LISLKDSNHTGPTYSSIGPGKNTVYVDEKMSECQSYEKSFLCVE
jgi:hypothetical protein